MRRTRWQGSAVVPIPSFDAMIGRCTVPSSLVQCLPRVGLVLCQLCLRISCPGSGIGNRDSGYRYCFHTHAGIPVSAVPDTQGAISGVPADKHVFVGRQPILNRQQRVIAYELLFRGSAAAQAANLAKAPDNTSGLLLDSFKLLGLDNVLGSKRAHVNVSANELLDDTIAALPPERLVFEIVENTKVTDALVTRCRDLRRAGYRFALDNFVYRPVYEPYVALADIIKFDVRALGAEGVRKQLAALKQRPIKFIASKVESQEEFRACRAMGIEYFQGFYFARPETLSVQRMDPQFLRAVQIFNLVAADAGTKRIEAEMRHDVALSFNLLRYINSPGVGLAAPMESVRHAIVILGPTKFAKC